MSNCKNCHSSEVTKNGFVRSKQRFVEGDERTRAFAVILYSLAKASWHYCLNVSPSTEKWLAKEAMRFQSIPVIGI